MTHCLLDFNVPESPGHLVKMQILIPQARLRPKILHLTSSKAMLLLLIHALHFEGEVGEGNIEITLCVGYSRRMKREGLVIFQLLKGRDSAEGRKERIMKRESEVSGVDGGLLGEEGWFG